MPFIITSWWWFLPLKMVCGGLTAWIAGSPKDRLPLSSHIIFPLTEKRFLLPPLYQCAPLKLTSVPDGPRDNDTDCPFHMYEYALYKKLPSIGCHIGINGKRVPCEIFHGMFCNSISLGSIAKIKTHMTLIIGLTLFCHVSIRFSFSFQLNKQKKNQPYS